jgi:serine phosphatase RsbU (regulator of sigma subunit)
VLACFSDGITEATNRAEKTWNESEIKKILCDNRHRSSTELVQKLIQGVDDYIEGREQADDITIVILRVL